LKFSLAHYNYMDTVVSRLELLDTLPSS